MEKNRTELKIIEIENFKSYRNLIVFGPFGFFSSLIGKNGSGKTNFFDAINFCLGGSLEEVNCFSIQNLFFEPNFYSNSKYETKIILKIKRKRKIKEFIRITSIQNISEFFINGLKVSLNFYKAYLKKYQINFVKELMSLKNPINNVLLFPNYQIPKIIDESSGSKKLSNSHLKIGLLRKKLQKTSLFYFKKLKLIIKEKNFRIQAMKKKKISLKIRKPYLKIKNCFFLKKIFKRLNKIGYIGKKQTLFLKKELAYQEMTSTCSLFHSREIIKKKKKKKILLNQLNNIFLIVFKNLKKILFDVSFFEKKIFIHQFLNIFDRELIFLVKKNKNKKQDIYIPCQNETSFFFFNKTLSFFRKDSIKNWLVQKRLKDYLILKKKKKNIKKKKKYLSNFKIYFGFLILLNFFKKKNIFQIKKKKIFTFKEKFQCLIHYSTILLLFILLEAKKTSKKKKNFQDSSQNIYSFVKNSLNGIRGKIEELVKPIDSMYKKNLTFLFGEQLKTIIVDTYDTAFKGLFFLRTFKQTNFNFFPLKTFPSNLITEKKKEDSKISKFFLDFDKHDSQIIIFFKKKNIAEEFFEKNNKLNVGIQEIPLSGNSFHCISFESQDINEKKMKKVTPQDFNLKKNLMIELLNKLTFKKKQNFSIIKETSILDNKEKKFFLSFDQKKLLRLDKYFSEQLYLSIFFLKKILIFKNSKYINKLSLIVHFFYFKNIKKNLRFIISTKRKNFYFYKKKKRHFSNLTFSIMDLFLNSKKIMVKNYLNPKKKLIIKKESFSKIGIKFFFGFRFFLNKEFFLLKIFFSKWKKDRKKTQNFGYDINQIKIFLVRFFSSSTYLNMLQKKINNNNLKKKIKYEQFLEVVLEQFTFSFLIKKFFGFFKIFWTSLFLEKKEKFFNFFFFCKLQKETEKIKKILKKFIQKKKNIIKSIMINFSLIIQKRKKSILINKRYEFFKKNLIDSRFRYLVANSKFFRIANERARRFRKFFNNLSEQINKLYKELTKTISNPYGGTAFLTIENREQPFLGKIFFTAIPPSKSFQTTQNLSGGEKTIALISLVVSFVQILQQPFILFDEIDSFLDTWHTEKFFLLLKKFSKTNKIQICIITLKIRFILFFEILIFLVKTRSGTNLITMD